MIHGGVASVFEKNFFEANNKCQDDFSPNREATYGVLVDASNLHSGIRENFFLPLKTFQTISRIDRQEILDTPIHFELGFFRVGSPLSRRATRRP